MQLSGLEVPQFYMYLHLERLLHQLVQCRGSQLLGDLRRVIPTQEVSALDRNVLQHKRT